MQIAINVNNLTTANKIFAYLKKFKPEEVVIETFEDSSFDNYLQSDQFNKDKDSLHKTLRDVTSKKTKLLEVDTKFWSDMDKVIESA